MNAFGGGGLNPSAHCDEDQQHHTSNAKTDSHRRRFSEITSNPLSWFQREYFHKLFSSSFGLKFRFRAPALRLNAVAAQYVPHNRRVEWNRISYSSLRTRISVRRIVAPKQHEQASQRRLARVCKCVC